MNISAEPLLKLLSGILDDTRNKYNEARKVQLKAIRVFCISEHNQSLLMWSHYAKYHTGVCFKLEVMADKDNPLCAAKKVHYVPRPPSFFRVEDWIDNIVLNKDRGDSDFYHRYPLTKSDIWEYENEWRVWAPFEDGDKSYLDVPIVEGEIDSIYFGVNADPKLVRDLISIASGQRIERFFRSEKLIKQYALRYTEI